MKRIIINGGKSLYGEITVGGSKNAALPIIFACLTIRGVSEIRNLPDIGDVRVALDILRGFGAKIRKSNGAVFIDTKELTYTKPDQALTSRIRASTYLLGGCLSRFLLCEISDFGGCNFSDRPIDLHLYAAECLGAKIDGCRITAPRLFGAVVDFKKPSVGATVNAILLASSAEGETVIRGYAREPHIEALMDFLVSAGAKIERSESEIRIVGSELHGGNITVVGDMIEAGTYLGAGLISGGEVTVCGCPSDQMSAILDAFSRLGAAVTQDEKGITVGWGDEMHPIDIVAAPYPAFPTDMQPIFAPILSRFCGGTVADTVWRTRFGYLDALRKFGIISHSRYGFATVEPSQLQGASVVAPDLRGGAACIMAALAAKGESLISGLETVERGYESFVEKLRGLGASVSPCEP